jgi:hypothetical protein
MLTSAPLALAVPLPVPPTVTVSNPPVLSVLTVILGAPGMPVSAAPLRLLIAESSAKTLLTYCVGITETQVGVPSATRAE